MASSLGKAIRTARERRGLTQAELAHELGVPQSTIARLERGGRTDPRLSTVIAIAGALHVSLDQLAFEAGLAARPPRAADVADQVGEAVSAARTARKALGDLDRALESVESLPGKARGPRR